LTVNTDQNCGIVVKKYVGFEELASVSNSTALTLPLTDGISGALLAVTATNAAGTGSASPAVNATPYTTPLPPTVVSATDPSGGQSVVTFSGSPSAANPVTSYTVTAAPTSGGAPITVTGTGTSLTLTGLQTGATYTISVSATNARGTTASSNTLQLVVTVPLAINAATISDTLINASYGQAISYTGYPAPSSWTVTSGSLPLGLMIDPSTGVISGTPAARTDGSLSFTVTASNGSSSASKTFTMTVSAPVAPAGAASIENFGTWNGVGTAEAKIINYVPELDFNNFVALADAGSYKTLTPGLDYTATQGSTIITFTQTYLDGLSNGTYYYIAEYTDYDTQGIRLIVDKSGNYYVSGGAGEGGRPSTGDDPYTLFLTTLLAIVSALCLLMLMLYYRYTYSSFRTRKR
jgi:hypothetical protein